MVTSEISKCLTPLDAANYVAGEMSAAEVQAIQNHLEGCEPCRATIRDEELFADVQWACGSEDGRFDRESELTSAGQQASDDVLAMDVAAGYRVLGELHRGGQGVVYQAVQLATKRTLALKVLLAGGAASPRQRQRFEREIDIAASLRHRCIVTIFDSGTYKGHQYLAMEYIEGKSLDQYLASKADASSSTRLARNARLSSILELFHKISGAIAYAHTRGVIHRDLKPGNIIVDDQDDPHVLDFGLAKLAEPTAAMHSPTISGEFLGTLAYASPEQTKGEPDQVDIRSDVYSLGVILYEMLTGRLPYEVSGPISETLSNICEMSPPRPSRICREIDDEVETIVMKALAKEPERRYQSAEHLDRDIRHYLAGEPIDAKRDSNWYLLCKSLKRYRLATSVAAAFAVVVVVAMVVSLTSLSKAVSQRNAARIAEANANVANQLAQAERNKAEAQREEADQQRSEAEHQSYLANLAAAAGALRVYDVVEATKRLNSAPERLRGWEWEQLVHELDGSRRTFRGHSSYVTHVAISPDGQLLASSGYDYTVRLWERRSGDLLAEITGPDRAAVAFHPVEQRLAIGWWNGEVRLWDIKTKAYVATFPGPHEGINTLTFSADGTRLAAAFHPLAGPAEEVNVRVWSLPLGELEHDLTLHGWPVGGLALNGQGTKMAVTQFHGVSLWDLETGGLLRRLPDQPGPENCAAFSHHGRWLATGGADDMVHLWDVESGAHIRDFSGHGSAVFSIAFGPDDERLVTGSRDKTIRIWDTATGSALRVLLGHDWGVTAVAVSQDGKRIVSGSWDQTVKAWDGLNARRRDLLPGHTAQVASVAFAPNGRLFATASWDHTVKLWDIAGRKVIATLEGHEDPVHCVAFSPDGQLLVTGGWNGKLKLWEVESHRELATLEGHGKDSRVHSVSFAPSGEWFVSGASQNELYMWDVKTREKIADLQGHEDHIHAAIVSADGKWIASAGHETVKVWDVAGRLEFASFDRTMVQDDYSLAFHPNSGWLAAGSAVGEMSIWDIGVPGSIKTMAGHSDEIHAVVFSPDGERLVSAAFDDHVKIWETESGRELATLYGYNGHINTVAFSPDGFFLVGGLDNGSIKIWMGASLGKYKNE